ncbi:hypothetical protein Aduo_017379 [Ancylostoma duodenale]
MLHCYWANLPPSRWRSPTICAETLAHDRSVAAKKRVSIVPDPPSMDVSISLACAAQMRAEHEQNKLREEEMNSNVDPVRKKSEEEVRKLSEERRMKILERRRMSTQDSPNGVPIMQAFQKAYIDVRAGRRRSVQDVEISAGHYASRPHLATVCDDEGSPTENRSVKSSLAETVIALKNMPPKPLAKDDSHEESASTDASQKPLLAVPPHHKQRKSITCIPPPTFLMVPAMMAMNTPPQSPGMRESNSTLKVPRLFDCPSPCSVPSNSSHSSYTSASSGDTFRRISMNSYGSSLTDNTDSTFEIDSRRSSAWSTLRNAVLEVGGSGRKAAVDITIDGSNGTPQKKISSISRGKLRRIATQVTRAIRRKRRESMAIRRESRATRVVAAILIAFLMCWIPYFCVSVIRGISMGFSVEINVPLHLQLYVITSWLGYAHSCFNPVIYMCLNKNFRATMRRMIGRTHKCEH